MRVEKLESAYYVIEGGDDEPLCISLHYDTKLHRWIVSNLDGERISLTREEGETVIAFLDWLSRISKEFSKANESVTLEPQAVTTEEGTGLCPQEDPDSCEYKGKLTRERHLDTTELLDDHKTSGDVEKWVGLTEKMAYSVDKGELMLGWKRDGRVSPVLRVSINKLKELYDRLPEEVESSDVRKDAEELNLYSILGFETYIMRVFSQRAEFGGELIKEGRALRLLKDATYLREENRRKLRQEAEVIGTPWEV